MIESITISNTASYHDTQFADKLSKINFFFGSNGTGKTTISRILASETAFPNCRINWQNGNNLATFVYNRDFVSKNFTETEIKGIFTLGEDNTNTKKKIDDLKSKVQNTETLLANANENLSNTKLELQQIDQYLSDQCWIKKQKYDDTFRIAFEGARNSKTKFKDKVIFEHSSRKAETVLSLNEIERKWEALRSSGESGKSPLTSIINSTKADALESDPILAKRIAGKDNVSIAAMIEQLGASDWVGRGRSYFDVNHGNCPFCQQATPASFAHALSQYFDETFARDCESIKAIEEKYKFESSSIMQVIDAMLAMPPRFLETDKLKLIQETLRIHITSNTALIEEKKREPSRSVELSKTGPTVSEINQLIGQANSAAETYNATIDNLSLEQAKLKEQMWMFILDELNPDILTYNRSTKEKKKSIEGITKSIQNYEQQIVSLKKQISELEKLTTSIQPTVEAINKILAKFGFKSFQLAKSQASPTYKLIRLNGTDAKETLSEGEKSFVTFLYFLHLLNGSQLSQGTTTPRVVVFDDPVSSLDSEVLFIVSSLIKGLFAEVLSKTSLIRQIFILTHNVYFHKEISFDSKRKSCSMNHESFWTIRKVSNSSKLFHHNHNPVKTSYELLWDEVRKRDGSNNTIQNTMRRILENYFKILGGIDFDEIARKFDGVEKQICKSLFSWVHDGSHYVHDDLYVSIDDSMADSYFRVFQEIFTRAGHESHYKMMMGENQSL